MIVDRWESVKIIDFKVGNNDFLLKFDNIF